MVIYFKLNLLSLYSSNFGLQSLKYSFADAIKYNKDGFPLESHNLLFKSVKELENVKFIMSNANVELVTSAFETYNIQHIIARRAINSKDPSSTAKEVVIHN